MFLFLLLSLCGPLFVWASGMSFGPTFVQEPPAKVLYSNNTGLVLDCLAKGEPAPIVDWVDDNGNVLPLMQSVAR